MGNVKSNVVWCQRKSGSTRPIVWKKNIKTHKKGSEEENFRQKTEKRNQQLNLETERRRGIILSKDNGPKAAMKQERKYKVHLGLRPTTVRNRVQIIYAKNGNAKELRKKQDKAMVMSAIKPFNYDQFCDLLKTNPFIQHPDIFEEAVHVDLAFHIPTDTEISPEHKSFTLRLMDNGYQITLDELDHLERTFLLTKKFRVLKACIIDFYSLDLKSLQELCRRSLKRAHLHSNSNYRKFVTNLNYPERLKSFLLMEGVSGTQEKTQGVYYKSFATYVPK